MVKRVVGILIKYNGSLFVATLLLLMMAVWLVPHTTFTGELDGFNVKDDPMQQTALYADSLFGDRNRIYIRIEPHDTTTAAVWSGLDKMKQTLKALLPNAPQHSLPRTIPQYPNPDTVSIQNFLHATSAVPLMQEFVSHDKTNFLLMLQHPVSEPMPVNRLDSILLLSYPGIRKAEALSLFHIHYHVERNIRKDLLLISSAAMLFFMMFCWYLYRNLGAIVFTLVHIGVCVTAAFILFGVFGVQLNVITILVIPVVLVLSLADSVHLLTGLAAHHTSSNADTVRDTLSLYIIPSAFSSLTTGIAFFTFYFFNDSEYIRDFGLVSGLALLLEFFLMFLVSPFMMMRLKMLRMHGKNIQWLDHFLFRNRARFSIILCMVLVASLFFAGKIRFSTSADLFIPNHSTLADVHERFNKDFYSQLKLDLLVQPKTRGVNNTFDFARTLSEKISAHPDVVGVSSAPWISSIPMVNAGFFIPTVAIPPANQNPFYHAESQTIRIEVSFRNADDIKNFYHESLPALQELAAGNYEIQAASQALIIDSVNKSIASSLITSLATSGITILLLVWLLTRSLPLTFMSLIPNLVPLAAVTIIFVLFGIDLNILTAISAVVCLGILDDDTIHILYRKIWLKRELEEVSFSIFSTSIILTTGFLFFLLSAFQPTRMFGSICAVVFLIGVISDLTFMPWMIDKWETFVQRKNSQQ